MQSKNYKFAHKKGFFLPLILVFASLFFAYATALVSYSIANIKSTTISNKKISALSIAEAGVNYYLWHMEHYPDDYCDLSYKTDGTVNEELTNSSINCNKIIKEGEGLGKNRPELIGFKGPYKHDYSDGTKIIGEYRLFIKDPVVAGGNPIIRSEGQLKGGGPIKKIVVEIGTKSLTKYAVLGDGYTGVNDTKSKYTMILTTKVDWQKGDNQGTKLDEPVPDGGDMIIDLATGKTTATHTSGLTQIYGSETLDSWDSFESDSFDRNSEGEISIKYQFRSGDGGENWTSWTTPSKSCTTVLPCSLSTINRDANHRYLQVLTTLTTINISITPKLSSYTVNYTKLEPTYAIMNIPSGYKIHGSVRNNGPINFNGEIDSNFLVESAFQGLIKTGSWDGDPDDPKYSNYSECHYETSPNRKFLCPAIWGNTGKPIENRKYPVASIDIGTVINDAYFDKLKEKAKEDGSPYYFDMNNRPGECGGYNANKALGVFFYEDKIAFYPVYPSTYNSFEKNACFEIKTSDLSVNSKNKIIYFDNTSSNTTSLGSFVGNSIMILGGKWNNQVSLVSNTAMYIRAMNLEYTQPATEGDQVKIGLMAKTRFVTGYFELYENETFIGNSYDEGSSICEQYPWKCKYLPPVKDSDYTKWESLKNEQTWNASFISQLPSHIQRGYTNGYKKLNLFGSDISMYGTLLWQFYDGNTAMYSRYDEVNITPDMGVSPPGFPFLNDVSIISWREE